MASGKPSKVRADRLVKLPKVVSTKVTWKIQGRGWRLRIKAAATDRDESFEVRGYIGRTNYSFVLLYRKYPLRKFTKHSPHNIGGKRFDEPHKHIWNGYTENKEAYIPDDIDPNDDINDQFLDFCRECNIKIVGQYQRVAYQIR